MPLGEVLMVSHLFLTFSNTLFPFPTALF